MLTFECKGKQNVVNIQIVYNKISTNCSFLTIKAMDKTMMLECLVNYYSDGNQAQFAAKLGIPAQNVSAWLKRNTFNAELIYSKCEGVSADWLLSGKGEMLRELHNVDTPAVNSDKELIELCKLLVENYQQRDEVMGKLVSMVKVME